MISLRKAFLAIAHPTTTNTLSRPIILYRRQPNGKFKTSVLVTALKRVLALTGSSPMEYVTTLTTLTPISHHLLKQPNRPLSSFLNGPCSSNIRSALNNCRKTQRIYLLKINQRLLLGRTVILINCGVNMHETTNLIDGTSFMPHVLHVKFCVLRCDFKCALRLR